MAEISGDWYLDHVRKHESNKLWSKEVEGFALSWDPSSLKTLMECPRKYYYSVVLGFRPRKESVHLTFGKYFHAGTEVWDKARAAGLSAEEARALTMDFILKHTYGWTEGNKEKYRFTLLRTVNWYTHKWENETSHYVMDQEGEPFIELGASIVLPWESPTGEDLFLRGYFDGIVMLGEELLIRERKTTNKTLNSEFFSKFSPDAQISTYILLGKTYDRNVRGVLLDAAQVKQYSSSFRRAVVRRTNSELDEFLADLKVWIQHAYNYAVHDHWPMATRHCYQCPFRTVCSDPASLRHQSLAEDFESDIYDEHLNRG